IRTHYQPEARQRGRSAHPTDSARTRRSVDRQLMQRMRALGPQHMSASDPKQTWPGYSWILLLKSRTAPSSLYNHLKAAVDHALSIKGHGVYIRLHARIGHDLLHALVSKVARRPDDPRKDDRFVVLAFDCHGKRGELPVGNIITPALHEFQSAMLLEHHCGRFGVFLVDFTIGSGNSGHKISPLFMAAS